MNCYVKQTESCHTNSINKLLLTASEIQANYFTIVKFINHVSPILLFAEIVVNNDTIISNIRYLFTYSFEIYNDRHSLENSTEHEFNPKFRGP